MPKSTKRFVLSNENLNEDGFKINTAGIDLAFFKNNPQLYWMLDANGIKTQSTILLNSFWTDIQDKDKEISAVPFFSGNDALAMKVYNKVEHGSIRAVTVVFEYIEFDTNVSNWKFGQKLPTVTKCKLTQASLSIGFGIDEDVAELHALNNIICLKKNNYASGVSLNPPFKNMDNNTDAKNANGNDHTPETKAILKNAVESGKFKPSEIDTLSQFSTNDPSVLSALKNVIKSAPIRPENIEGKYSPALIKQAAGNTYDDIVKHVPGGLNHLKAGAPELYKAKFFEKFGRLPADVA